MQYEFYTPLLLFSLISQRIHVFLLTLIEFWLSSYFDRKYLFDSTSRFLFISKLKNYWVNERHHILIIFTVYITYSLFLYDFCYLHGYYLKFWLVNLRTVARKLWLVKLRTDCTQIVIDKIFTINFFMYLSTIKTNITCLN